MNVVNQPIVKHKLGLLNMAEELGNDDYDGSAEDNIRLHRQTMQELARNGGKVPAQFLD